MFDTEIEGARYLCVFVPMYTDIIIYKQLNSSQIKVIILILTKMHHVINT